MAIGKEAELGNNCEPYIVRPDDKMMMLVICSDTGFNETIFGWCDLWESEVIEA